MALEIDRAVWEGLTLAEVEDGLRLAQIAYPQLPSALDLFRSVGLEPDPWQAQVLTTEARRIILLCSRQSGKSQVAGALAVQQAISTPRSLIVLGSGSEPQAGETLLRAKDITLSDVFSMAITANSAYRLSLANRSRFVVVPTRNYSGRGYPGVNLVIIDEAAFVDDEFFAAIDPSLVVSHGRQILLSTPHAMAGVFYETWKNAPEWQEGMPAEAQPHAWLKIEVPWQLCPRITQADVDDYRTRFGEQKTLREYCCQFTAEDMAAYPPEQVEAILQPGIGQWRVF
jgi:hypothetical protein